MVQQPPTRVERRLSAILAADVAGYSRLMGLDEVGTARVLREHRAVSDALVAKHGGRIVKTTGDGVLIEFPSVVDAVECAVAVQAVMAERNDGVPEDQRMLFRIGIKRKAVTEYEKAQEAIQKNYERLRAERLAREAAKSKGK